MCVCSCVCMFMCVCGMCPFLEARGWHWVLSSIAFHFSFWGRISYCIWGLSIWLDELAVKSRAPPVSTSPALGLKVSVIVFDFYRVLGIWTQVFMLWNKRFIDRARSLRPGVTFSAIGTRLFSKYQLDLGAFCTLLLLLLTFKPSLVTSVRCPLTTCMN